MVKLRVFSIIDIDLLLTIVDLKYVIQENFEICNVLALEKAKIPTSKNKVLSLPILLYK